MVAGGAGEGAGDELVDAGLDVGEGGVGDGEAGGREGDEGESAKAGLAGDDVERAPDGHHEQGLADVGLKNEEGGDEGSERGCHKERWHVGALFGFGEQPGGDDDEAGFGELGGL